MLMSGAIDRVDLMLLNQLMRDARTSYADLARIVHRSESTVRERVGALERSQVIRGYRAVVDPKWLGYGMEAFLRAKRGTGSIDALAAGLRAIPNVREAFITTGPRPIHVRIGVGSLDEAERLVETRLSALSLSGVETEVVTHALVTDRPLQPALGESLLTFPAETSNGPGPLFPLENRESDGNGATARVPVAPK